MAEFIYPRDVLGIRECLLDGLPVTFGFSGRLFRGDCVPSLGRQLGADSRGLSLIRKPFGLVGALGEQGEQQANITCTHDSSGPLSGRKRERP
jgi:hypothetical protein